jgi:hypothetical protein
MRTAINETRVKQTVRKKCLNEMLKVIREKSELLEMINKFCHVL